MHVQGTWMQRSRWNEGASLLVAGRADRYTMDHKDFVPWARCLPVNQYTMHTLNLGSNQNEWRTFLNPPQYGFLAPAVFEAELYNAYSRLLH